MASNRENKKGGYDCIWIKQPSDELFCQICDLVARDPYQHGNGGCGKLFCKYCVRGSVNCPHCPHHRPFETFKDDRAARSIRILGVKCNNIENGCQWQGELGSLEAHEAICDYTFITCPNQCKHEEEDRTTHILRKDLRDHCDNNCPKRQFECPHCHEIGEYWEWTTTHLETCPNIEIQCPNAQCEVNFLRQELENHRKDCEYELVTCRYVAVGCKEKPFRKNLEEHEQDDRAHLHLALNTSIRLQRDLAQVNATLKELVKPLNMQVFKLTMFSRWKNNGQLFHSPAFYTSRAGYKMYIEVYPNGCGKGRNTHISVAAHLMRGDYDDFLIWPFTGEVTFELLNQLEDKSHHSRTVTFPPDKECSQRVMEDEHDHGFGEQKFITHQDLHYRPNQNCLHLKDDILVFRISIIIRSRMPWLECTI